MTHHHVLEGLGDEESHAPVGQDTDGAGESPHFDREDLRHDQPWDRAPTQGETCTPKPIITVIGCKTENLNNDKGEGIQIN